MTRIMNIFFSARTLFSVTVDLQKRIFFSPRTPKQNALAILFLNKLEHLIRTKKRGKEKIKRKRENVDRRCGVLKNTENTREGKRKKRDGFIE